MEENEELDPISKLKAHGYSEEDVSAWKEDATDKFKAHGYSDEDIAGFFQTPIPTEPVYAGAHFSKALSPQPLTGEQTKGFLESQKLNPANQVPTYGDFSNATSALAGGSEYDQVQKNLLDLYNTRGLHPSNAAYEAHLDPLVYQSLLSDGPDEAEHYDDRRPGWGMLSEKERHQELQDRVKERATLSNKLQPSLEAALALRQRDEPIPPELIKKLKNTGLSPYSNPKDVETFLNLTKKTIEDGAQFDKGMEAAPTKTGWRSAGENIIRSATDSVISIPEYVGIAKGYLQHWTVGSEVEDELLQKLARSGKDWAADHFPGDQARQNDFLQQLASTGGMVAGLYGPGGLAKLGATGVARLAGMSAAGAKAIGGAAQGATMLAGGAAVTGTQGFEEATKARQEAQEAKETREDVSKLPGVSFAQPAEPLPEGPTEGQRLTGTLGQTAVGAAMAVPIARAATGGLGGGSRVGRAAAASIEQGLAFPAYGAAGNWVAKQTYSPDRSIWEGMWTQAGIGMSMGFLTGFASPGAPKPLRATNYTPEQLSAMMQDNPSMAQDYKALAKATIDHGADMPPLQSDVRNDLQYILDQIDPKLSKEFFHATLPGSIDNPHPEQAQPQVPAPVPGAEVDPIAHLEAQLQAEVGHILPQSWALKAAPELGGGEGGGEAYSFGGEQAKHYPGERLKSAMDMETAGEGREAIWDKTGWRHDVDGRWKFEIDDSKADINEGVLNQDKRDPGLHRFSGELGELVSHDELFKQYPELANMKVHFSIDTSEMKPEDYSGAAGPDYITVRAGGMETAKRTLLHEIQHEVQYIEKFNSGSDLGHIQGTKEFGEIFEQMLGEKGLTHDDFNDFFSPRRSEYIKTIEEAAFQAYRRSSGEVESRNVEARKDLAPEERREYFPWQTQDITDEGRILHGADLGGADSFGGKWAGKPPVGRRLARQMEKSGASKEDIWKETGWRSDVDGKWKFEIDDSKAKIKEAALVPDAQRNDRLVFIGRLANILRHDSLFKQYPYISNLTTTFIVDPKASSHSGEFSEGISALGRTLEEAKSVLLHEVQHAVQREEGFARGGNPKAEEIQKLPEFKEELEKRLKEYGLTHDDKRPGFPSGTERFTPDEFGKASAYAAVERDAAYAVYRRLSGETEARNVQARLGLTEEERRASYPGETQDITDDKRIVLGDHGGAAYSIGSGLQAFYNPAIRAVEGTKQAKMNGDQWLKMLQGSGQKGVQKRHIEEMDLEDFLKDKKGVTKDELLSYMRMNEAKLEEAVHGGLTDEEKEFQKEWREAPLARHEFPQDVKDRLQKLDDKTLSGWSSDPTTYSPFLAGINPHEFVIRDPKFTGYYEEKHFGGPVALHIRTWDLEGPNGEKVLGVGEIQSEGHQKARKHGYLPKVESSEVQEARKFLAEYPARRSDILRRLDEASDRRARGFLNDELDALEDQSTSFQNVIGWGDENKPIPRMALADGAWLEFGMKRALQFAAEHGYDGITWANAEQIAGAVGANPEALAADYNKKIPSWFNKIAKKYKAESGEVETSIASKKNPFIHITPEMRQDLLEKGQAYSRRKNIIEGMADPKTRTAWISAMALDPSLVAREEAGHAIKHSGLYRPGEWETLTDAAKKEGWIDNLPADVRAEYEKTYASRGSEGARDAMIEEAIMHRFAAGPEAWGEEGGIIHRLFQRLQELLERVGNWMKAQGFQSANDVFRAMNSGEIAARDQGDIHPERKDVVAYEGKPNFQRPPFNAAKVTSKRAKLENDYHMSPEAFMSPDPYMEFGEEMNDLPDDVNSEFQVHGVSAVGTESSEDALVRLLTHGIDSEQSFHSGPPRGGSHGVDTTRTLNPYLILSGRGEMLKGQPIKFVILNGVAKGLIDEWRHDFPSVRFLTVDEAKTFMLSGDLPKQAPPPPPPGGGGNGDIINPPPPSGGSVGGPRWYSPGEVEAARRTILARISIGAPDYGKGNSIEKLYKNFIDQFYFIGKAVKKVTGESASSQALPTEDNPYHRVRMYPGKDGRITHILNHGTIDFDTFEINGKGLKQILEPVKDDLNGLRAFMVAARNIEKMKQGLDTGVDPAASQIYGTVAAPRFAEAMMELVGFQNRMLDYLVKSGVVSENSRAAMQEMNKFYNPWHRVFGPDENEGWLSSVSGGRNLTPRNPIKKFKGSERKIIDPLETIVKNVFTFVEMAERNVISEKLVGMLDHAQKQAEISWGELHNAPEKLGVEPTDVNFTDPNKKGLPGGDLKLGGPEKEPGVPVPYPYEKAVETLPSDISPADREAATEYLKRQGIEAPDEYLIDMLAAEARGPDKHGVLSVYREGKRTVHRVDAELSAAIKGLDSVTIGSIEKFLAIPATMLRSGAVATPEFALRHLFRSLFYTAVTIKNGIYNPKDMAMSMFGLVFKTEKYWEWMKSGGANIWTGALDRDAVQEKLDQLTDKTGFATRAINVVIDPDCPWLTKGGAVIGLPPKYFTRYILHPLQVATEFSENVGHFAGFQKDMAAIDRKGLGETSDTPDSDYKRKVLRAGWASRETGVDTRRIGAQMRAFNMLTAFSNIVLQDTDRVARAIKDDPVNTTMKIAIGIMLPSAFLWYANKDRDEYKDLPEWQKRHFWHVYADKGNGKVYDFRLPKPFSAGVLFGSGMEAALDRYFNDNPEAFKGFASSMAEASIPHFIPQALIPPMEQFANRSTFFNKHLIPKSMEKFLPEYQYTEHTTPLARMLAQTMASIPGVREASLPEDPGVVGQAARAVTSPILLENYIRGWTGGLGRHMLELLDYAAQKSGAVKEQNLPETSLEDNWFLRSFMVRHPNAQTQPIQDFVDEYSRHEKYFDTWQAQMKAGDQEAAKRVRAMGGDQNLVLLKGINEGIKAQYLVIRMAYGNPGVEPWKQREIIDQAYSAMNMFAKSGSEMMKQATQPANPH